jgi:hypothetical protein
MEVVVLAGFCDRAAPAAGGGAAAGWAAAGWSGEGSSGPADARARTGSSTLSVHASAAAVSARLTRAFMTTT